MMNAATVSFKKGVLVKDVKTEVFHIISVVATVYQLYGLFSLVVTSISDGKHKPNSKHYEGYAADFRIWGISPAKLQKIAADIQARLGKDYDVVVEATHIHIEYDPKEAA